MELTDLGRIIFGIFTFIMIILIPVFTIMVPYYLSQINLNLKGRMLEGIK